MAAREKAPDGAEPLIIQEGGEPTSKEDKPADKPGSGPAKERPRRPTANGPGPSDSTVGSFPTPLTAFLLRDVPARVSYTLTLVIPGSVKDLGVTGCPWYMLPRARPGAARAASIIANFAVRALEYRHHWSLILASWITLAHFAVSATMRF